MKDELIAIVANTLGIDVKNVPYEIGRAHV